MIRLVTGTAGLGVAWVALMPSSPSTDFAVPLDTARARLSAERRLVEGTGMGSLSLSGFVSDKDTVTVRVKRAGSGRAPTCRVTLSAASAERTEASINCEQTAVPESTARRAGEQAVGLVVAEHVAAAIEDRPYDTDAVADRMMALAVASGPAMMSGK